MSQKGFLWNYTHQRKVKFTREIPGGEIEFGLLVWTKRVLMSFMLKYILHIAMHVFTNKQKKTTGIQ